VSVSIDVSGLDALARSLDDAGDVIPHKVHQATEVTARKIKDDARKLAKGIGRPAQHYWRSISYDIDDLGDSVYAEIGPDKLKTQGPLGVLLEFGSVNNAPRPHLSPAFQANQGDFETGLGKAVEESFE
jgi:HK97 gp10 family phage protein